eukprot:TRINITY_DN10967_c0_g1_i1.p1 TRINITY_DN10967_c0_g1~~TRINITY_DN10967_c0_g1_i1.p1  ORF type:complete len:143 (-),score=33.49 TRINITY_DN10967_c0_g1_i1:88-516(-)
MKYGLFATQTFARRTDIAKHTMCKEGVADDERTKISTYLKVEKAMNYSGRILVVPILYLLYRRKFFDKPSPFFIREVGAFVGSLGFILACDYLGSELLWGNTEAIVRKHNQYTEKYYVDEKSLTEMRKKQTVAQETEEKFYN